MSTRKKTSMNKKKRALALGDKAFEGIAPFQKKQRTFEKGKDGEYLPSESESDDEEEIKVQWNIDKRLGKKSAEHFVRVNQYYTEVVERRRELLKSRVSLPNRGVHLARLTSILRSIVTLSGHKFKKNKDNKDIIPILTLLEYNVLANREIFLGITGTWFKVWVAEGSKKNHIVASNVAKREPYIWVLHLYQDPQKENTARPSLDFTSGVSIQRSADAMSHLIPSIMPSLPVGCRAARNWFLEIRDKFVSLFQETARAYMNGTDKFKFYRLLGMMEVFKR